MKYIDGFRNPDAAACLRQRIAGLAEKLAAADRHANIMEVCGTHTMAIARYGIRDLLPRNVTLVSGPGCPVCVTSPGYIDAAIELAAKGAIIATFGDLAHVPGSETTLAETRSAGGAIKICYSPLAALDLARKNPEREIVFLAVGFETTIAPITSLVDKAIGNGIENLSLLTAFKLIPPALQSLVTDPEVRIDAFLCPAHVTAIIGADAYEPFARDHGVPCVVAGFEPLDIMLGLQGILQQLNDKEARVENQYSRVARPEGNRRARALIDKYLCPVDATWRGIGIIPNSGLSLRQEYARFDAAKRHNVGITAGKTDPRCLCGDVIRGKHLPPDCKLFAAGCTPDHPVGPCMVSTEGTCAAYYKYSRKA